MEMPTPRDKHVIPATIVRTALRPLLDAYVVGERYVTSPAHKGRGYGAATQKGSSYSKYECIAFLTGLSAATITKVFAGDNNDYARLGIRFVVVDLVVCKAFARPEIWYQQPLCE